MCKQLWLQLKGQQVRNTKLQKTNFSINLPSADDGHLAPSVCLCVWGCGHPLHSDLALRRVSSSNHVSQ